MGSKEDPMYIATTDWPYPQRFDINTLDTLELLRPENGFGMTKEILYNKLTLTDGTISNTFRLGFDHSVL